MSYIRKIKSAIIKIFCHFVDGKATIQYRDMRYVGLLNEYFLRQSVVAGISSSWQLYKHQWNIM
jgi:hypothetical protein